MFYYYKNIVFANKNLKYYLNVEKYKNVSIESKNVEQTTPIKKTKSLGGVPFDIMTFLSRLG